jgi:hypothetical protein
MRGMMMLGVMMVHHDDDDNDDENDDDHNDGGRASTCCATSTPSPPWATGGYTPASRFQTSTSGRGLSSTCKRPPGRPPRASEALLVCSTES